MSYLRICAITALAVTVLFTSSSFFLVSSRAGSSLVPNSPILTALDMGAVSLDWNDVPNAAEYELRYRDIEWNPLPHGDIQVTIQGSSAVVHGLPGGSEYAFAVRTRAVNGNWSDWSEPLYEVALPARVLPVQPANLIVTKREPGAVTLDWQGHAPLNSYQVSYWHTSEAEGQWVILPDAGIEVSMDESDGSGAIVSHLPEESDRVHSFAVRALTEGGFSEWSEVVQAPDNLKAPETLSGWYREPGLIELDWRDVSGADTYQVLFWHVTEVVSEWVILPVANAQVSIDGSRALVDLQPDNTDMMLSFSVRAVNEVSQSPWSQVADVNPNPDTPDGLSGQQNLDGSITLDWTDVNAANSYEVRFLQETDTGPQWVVLPAAEVAVVLDGSSASVSQLPGYNAFSFQIRAVGEGNSVSDWSETIQISNQAATPTPAATLVPTLVPTATLTLEPTPTLDPAAGSTNAALTPTLTPTPERRSRSSGSSGSSSPPPPPTPTPRPTSQSETGGRDCGEDAASACRLLAGSTASGRVSHSDDGNNDNDDDYDYFKFRASGPGFYRIRLVLRISSDESESAAFRLSVTGEDPNDLVFKPDSDFFVFNGENNDGNNPLTQDIPSATFGIPEAGTYYFKVQNLSIDMNVHYSLTLSRQANPSNYLALGNSYSGSIDGGSDSNEWVTERVVVLGAKGKTYKLDFTGTETSSGNPPYALIDVKAPRQNYYEESRGLEELTLTDKDGNEESSSLQVSGANNEGTWYFTVPRTKIHFVEINVNRGSFDYTLELSEVTEE